MTESQLAELILQEIHQILTSTGENWKLQQYSTIGPSSYSDTNWASTYLISPTGTLYSCYVNSKTNTFMLQNTGIYDLENPNSITEAAKRIKTLTIARNKCKTTNSPN